MLLFQGFDCPSLLSFLQGLNHRSLVCTMVHVRRCVNHRKFTKIWLQTLLKRNSWQDVTTRFSVINYLDAWLCFYFWNEVPTWKQGCWLHQLPKQEFPCNHGYVRSEDEVQWLRAMDHGEGKWTVDDDKFSNADTGSIEKQLRVLNCRFEQLLTQKPESMPPDTSGTLVCQFLVGWLLHSN